MIHLRLLFVFVRYVYTDMEDRKAQVLHRELYMCFDFLLLRVNSMVCFKNVTRRPVGFG